MAKEIIVNVDHRETRIAVLLDKQLTELHVEREQRVVGNLYKAKVDNVLPGMDAAFVEIGLERNAFLYVADILPEDDEDGGGRGRNRRDLHIGDLVRRGDQLLVQVVKGPRSTKGSRVSSRVSLPGRFLVLMPEANNLGVSRKIEEGKERDRLKKIVQKFREPGFGVIVRTESEGRSGGSELRQDYLMLVETWRAIKQKAEKSRQSARPDPSGHGPGVQDSARRLRFGRQPPDHRLAHRLPPGRTRSSPACPPTCRTGLSCTTATSLIFEHFKMEDDIERLLRRKVHCSSPAVHWSLTRPRRWSPLT